MIFQQESAKLPLGENGGVPVDEADMPISELDTTYNPDVTAE